MELTAHGAPDDLIEEARRAREDEVRHARATRTLAVRFGAAVKWPASEPPSVARSLFEIALENAREGCVVESFGAAVALVGAARAADPDVRATMRSIAGDECRHAELSWRVLTWIAGRLSTDERAHLVRHVRASAEALAELACGLRPTPACATACGLPTPEERRLLAAVLNARLFQDVERCVARA